MAAQCESCKNTFWIDSSEICPKCAGGCFDVRTQSPCKVCNGTGKVEVRKPCPLCNSSGEKSDKRLIIR
jgi:DnaJ-class molecular chaperone